MSPISTIGNLQSSLLNRLQPAVQNDAPTGPVQMPGVSLPESIPNQPSSFGTVMDSLISSVDAKQQQANSLSRDVLLGKTDNLHQSVIAMQEASTALSLMVQVRNKVVDSYQELMRMPV